MAKIDREIVVNLIENVGLSYSAVGKVIGRSKQRAWAIYHNYVSDRKLLPNKNGYAFSSDSKKISLKNCKVCGRNQKIEVHHIDNDHNNNKSKNLIPVCDWCHQRFHNSISKYEPCFDPSTLPAWQTENKIFEDRLYSMLELQEKYGISIHYLRKNTKTGYVKPVSWQTRIDRLSKLV